MSWFLVLLFWNPAFQGYDVADGWYPLPYETETICEMKLDFASMYLPSYSVERGSVISCVRAGSMWDAINEAKEIANE